MSERFVIVTGCAGGIGGAVAIVLRSAGFRVVGIDFPSFAERSEVDEFIGLDLKSVVELEDAEKRLRETIEVLVGDSGLAGLVNNAAYQHTGGINDLERGDWERAFAVNVGAPFFISRVCLPSLRRGAGSIVNVSSVHARLTKPGFLLYSTSKSALSGLTRALALEIGMEIPVFGIEPGAVNTAMLRAGFSETPAAYDALRQFQPLGEIITPEEIASLIEFLIIKRPRALSGATIEAGGGIASRLHDPV